MKRKMKLGFTFSIINIYLFRHDISTEREFYKNSDISKSIFIYIFYTIIPTIFRELILKYLYFLSLNCYGDTKLDTAHNNGLREAREWLSYGLSATNHLYWISALKLIIFTLYWSAGTSNLYCYSNFPARNKHWLNMILLQHDLLGRVITQLRLQPQNWTIDKVARSLRLPEEWNDGGSNYLGDLETFNAVKTMLGSSCKKWIIWIELEHLKINHCSDVFLFWNRFSLWRNFYIIFH